MLTIATWNINSVRLRLPLIQAFAQAEKPDIIALQETKCPEAAFPAKAFRDMGFPHLAIAGQKGYHGVAIASRLPFAAIEKLPFCQRGEARHVGVVIERPQGPVFIDNLYIPAGGDVPDRTSNPKFDHKLDYYQRLTDWSGRLAREEARSRRLLIGDFNVAPHENDVWNHKHMLKVVSHTPQEIEAVCRLRAAYPWDDTVRRFIPESEKLFSWWSYRARDWRQSNRGLRLDHVWASPAIADAAEDARVLADWRGAERPSDHVPVISRYRV